MAPCIPKPVPFGYPAPPTQRTDPLRLHSFALPMRLPATPLWAVIAPDPGTRRARPRSSAGSSARRPASPAPLVAPRPTLSLGEQPPDASSGRPRPAILGPPEPSAAEVWAGSAADGTGMAQALGGSVSFRANGCSPIGCGEAGPGWPTMGVRAASVGELGRASGHFRGVRATLGDVCNRLLRVFLGVRIDYPVTVWLRYVKSVF